MTGIRKTRTGRRVSAILLLMLGWVLLSTETARCEAPSSSDAVGPLCLKTPVETFTHKFFFALRNGRILVRPGSANGPEGTWELLNGTGLPSSSPGKPPFSDISSIREISADGDNLVAVSDKYIVYYTKTYNWKWKDHFSALPFTKQLIMPSARRAWGISHRGNFMKYYRDIDGNPHSVSAGVTTLYLLAGDGHTITYADPWLPPAFTHTIDTPEKGTFIAANMSVSGSTLFLISEAGEMYTRLYDFDTSGQNPALPYSYKREQRAETRRNRTRSLPPEDWRRQPGIFGTITDLITIFQTGEGNESFELRVEGRDAEGRTGYFTKTICGDAWSFVETGLPLKGRPVSPDVAPSRIRAPRKAKDLSGFIRLGDRKIPARLLDFWPFSPPAVLQFTIGRQTFNARLHMRQYHHRRNDTLACAATIELPPELCTSTAPEVRDIYEQIFHSSPLTDLVLVRKRNVVQGVEDLHVVGISELADTIVSLFVTKTGLKGELDTKFHTRLRFTFDRTIRYDSPHK